MNQLTPFYRLLATRYDPNREMEAIAILDSDPGLALRQWSDDDAGSPTFIRGSTALHYAANDGKLLLMERLVEYGADVNASLACWYRSVLSWAANNARLDAMQWLLARGATADSLDALHAAAWGGPTRGTDPAQDYVAALQLLIEAGADMNDPRHCQGRTPLRVALECGHHNAVRYLRSLGAQ